MINQWFAQSKLIQRVDSATTLQTWLEMEREEWKGDTLFVSRTCTSSDTPLISCLVRSTIWVWSFSLATPKRNPLTAPFPWENLDLRSWHCTSQGRPGPSTDWALGRPNALTELPLATPGHQQREGCWFLSGFKAWLCHLLEKYLIPCDSQLFHLQTETNKIT